MKQKGLRKLVSMILAVVMVLAMSATAFADNGTADTCDYSIVISDANEGQTYKAYKIFDAVYDSTTSSKVTYYIDDEDSYYSAVAIEADKETGALFKLISTGTEGYYQVVVNDGVSDDSIIEFFVSLGARGSSLVDATAEEDGSLTLYLENAGYYFVTTTTGSVVSIDTTNPSASITDKNDEPTVDKEETTDGTAGIGDTVNYEVTIIEAEDISDLTYHDVMSEGLTFDSSSVVVKIVTPATVEGEDDTEVTLEKDTDYEVVIPDSEDANDDECTFEIVFTSTGLAKISVGDSIVMTYSATVNENAVIDGEGNTNTGSLSYDNDGKTVSEPVVTKVYDFDLKKTDGTNEIDGAEFSLAKTDSANNLISFVAVDDGYRVATAEEIVNYNASQADDYTGESVTDVSTTIVAGSVNISGLDAGTYTLTETKAPAGYNQLEEPLTVTINEDGTVTFGGDTVTEVEVKNAAGSSLPSTGGIGTTIFYIVGGVLALGAAVLFVTRKRLGSEN